MAPGQAPRSSLRRQGPRGRPLAEMVVSVRGRSHIKTTAKRLWDEHSHPPRPRRLGPGPTPRSRERRPRPPPWALVPALGGPPGLPGPFPDEELGWGQGTQVLLGEQTEPGRGRPAGGVHASQPHGPTMSAAVPILGPGPGAAGSSAPEHSGVGVPAGMRRGLSPSVETGVSARRPRQASRVSPARGRRVPALAQRLLPLLARFLSRAFLFPF